VVVKEGMGQGEGSRRELPISNGDGVEKGGGSEEKGGGSEEEGGVRKKEG
jgi:hypothetical protein